MELDRTPMRQVSRKADDGPLRRRIREWAEAKRRSGCRRIYVRVRREEWKVNPTKGERISREERLSLRLRKRRKFAACPRVEMPKPNQPGKVYAMDFVPDRPASGRRFKCLTMTDPCSKEGPVIETDFSINGIRLCRILDQIFADRPLPETLGMDNGPEFSGQALDAWAFKKNVKLHFIQLGKPTQNAFCESFNGKVRDECLNDHWFLTLQEAQGIIEAWRKEYNEERTPRSIGDITPMEFIKNINEMAAASQGIAS